MLRGRTYDETLQRRSDGTITLNQSDRIGSDRIGSDRFESKLNINLICIAMDRTTIAMLTTRLDADRSKIN
jgi:hypothetical protein